MPGGVVVSQGTLDPLTQVRILAGQPTGRPNMSDFISNCPILGTNPVFTRLDLLQPVC